MLHCPSDQFRSAMRGMASSVAVLTTNHLGRRLGLTATAFNSLSVDPPALVVCVNRGAGAYEAIIKSKSICVNVLSDDQADIAARFSGMLGHKGEERFEGQAWTELSTGAPVLPDAGIVFDCTIADTFEYKTHTILVCLVAGVVASARAQPLVYLDGRYGSVVTEKTVGPSSGPRQDYTPVSGDVRRNVDRLP